EVAEHPTQGANHTRICVGRRDVLTDGVKRATATPRVEQVPLVGALVRRIDVHDDATRTNGAVRIGEARNRLVGVEVATCRNPRPARISPEVDVYLAAARLTPDETDQIAPVATDGLAVCVPPADPRVQRSRHPGRAIDGSLNAIGKRLPTASPGCGA